MARTPAIRVTGQRDILKDIDSPIRIPDRRVETMYLKIRTLIEEDEVLSDDAGILAAVPGIGPALLAPLPGELPELGRHDRRKIASLAGLAPHTRESGTWRGQRKVREPLYIAALSATHGGKGRAPGTILIAVG